VRKIGVIGVLLLLRHFRLNGSLPVSQMMSQSQSSLSQVTRNFRTFPYRVNKLPASSIKFL
jgi:hypothetical protein